MSANDQVRNRKERRAAAKANPQFTKASEIPLKTPSREGPKTKTLLEIATERQAELQGGQPFSSASSDTSTGPQVITTSINPDGTLSIPSGTLLSPTAHSEPVGPFAQAIFLSITLTMLHFTFDVLVHQQYRQSIAWDIIIQRAALTFPILATLVYMLHSRAQKIWAQVLFLGMSVGTGCYLTYASNEEVYFAVMKRAPPLGTLWVWSVVEMRLEAAILSVAAVGGYFWWGGFKMF
ncbi:hypothetical protein MMC30_008065 [Trapelia coarctata]|nr:hypothetical protein [Trapelia coarctata]